MLKFVSLSNPGLPCRTQTQSILEEEKVDHTVYVPEAQVLGPTLIFKPSSVTMKPVVTFLPTQATNFF